MRKTPEKVDFRTRLFLNSRMDSGAVNSLTVMIRKRQLELWRHIRVAFEVEDTLYSQVQTWIQDGTLTERAYDRHRARIKRRGPQKCGPLKPH